MANKREPNIVTSSQRKVSKCSWINDCKNDLFFEMLETTFNSEKFLSFMDNFVAQSVQRFNVTALELTMILNETETLFSGTNLKMIFETTAISFCAK